MASYVFIELDTSSPIIEIFAPRYTTRENVNLITVVSNEKLSSYQDIYAIDNLGTRYDFTLEQISDVEFSGEIQFVNFPIGIVTLYARMKDDVDNFSNVVSISIEIKMSIEAIRANVMDDEISIIKMNENQLNVDINDSYNAHIKVLNNSMIDLDIKDYSKLNVIINHQGG